MSPTENNEIVETFLLDRLKGAFNGRIAIWRADGEFDYFDFGLQVNGSFKIGVVDA